MKFRCQTLFDITATGITGHYKSSLDLTQSEWNRARNQQRNWETLVQILSLRTQVFELSAPIRDTAGTRWMFEFETESNGIYGPESDPVQVLRDDANSVPMLCDLDNVHDLEPFLITSGGRQNIWFSPVAINT